MSNGQWLVLALACGAGIAGLLVAASGNGDTTYWLGLALFAGAAIYIGLFVKRHFDRIDQARR